MEFFTDDFSVYKCKIYDFLANLEKVIKVCVKANLVLNWEKCQFIMKKGIILGHLIFERGIEVDRAKIKVIKNFNPPIIVREVRSLLGHVSFYHRFI